MIRSARRLAHFIGLFAVMAAFLSSGISRADEAPVEVYAVLPITGFGAFFGKATVQSVQAFEALTNRTGGIRGRPIKFIILDDETNPQVSVQLFSQIAAKHGTVVIGPGFTASCSAVLPLLTDGPLDYCLSPGTHPPPGSYMFGADASTIVLWGAEVQYARERGWTRIATILTNDASGQDIARQIDTLLALPENKAVQLVSRQTFNPSDLSVGAQMANIKSANPSVLLTGATGSPFGTLLRGARDAGLDVPLFASSTNMTPEQMTQYVSYLPHDLLFANPRGVIYEPGAPTPIRNAQRTFFDAFRATGVHPGQGHTIPWDAMSIIVDALRHLGANAQPAQLRDYIANLDHWSGISGTYDFRRISQRGIGLDSVAFYRWNETKGDYDVLAMPNGRR